MDMTSWDGGAGGHVPERTAAAALGTRRRRPHQGDDGVRVIPKRPSGDND